MIPIRRDATGGWIARRRAAFLLVVLVGLGLGIWFYAFTLDDPFISFRYARNMVDGNGLVFNPGEHVEGYSNLLWVLLMALVIGGGGDPIFWSKILGLTFFVASIPLTMELGRYFVEPNGDRVLMLAPGLFLASSCFAALWSVGGLETAAFSFFLLLGLYLYARRLLVAAAMALFMATLTRPEGAAFFLILALVEAWRAVVRRERRPLFALLLVFCIPFALLEAWRISYYGDFVPNVYYTKTGGDPEVTLGRGVSYVANFLGGVTGHPLGSGKARAEISGTEAVAALAVVEVFLVAAVIVSLCRRRWVIVTAAAWVGVYLLYVVSVGGDWMPAFRFGVPALPFLGLLGAAGFSSLESRIGAWPRAARVISWTIVGLLLCICARSQLRSVMRQLPDLEPPWIQTPLDRLEDYLRVADWLERNTADDAVVAIEEAGVIPYFSGRPTLDLFGLTERHLAHAPGQPPFGKKDDAYVLHRAPEYVVLWHHAPRGGGRGIGWMPHASLLENPRFLELYRHVESLPRGEGYFLIFRLAESPSTAQLRVTPTSPRRESYTIEWTTGTDRPGEIFYCGGSGSGAEEFVARGREGIREVMFPPGRVVVRLYRSDARATLLRVVRARGRADGPAVRPGRDSR